MPACHITTPVSKQVAADESLRRIQAFVDERRRSREPSPDLESFERELHAMVTQLERDLLAEELARFDLDVPSVLIEGVEHRRVLRCEQTYLSAAGPLRVERSLYADRTSGEAAVCPLELGAGIVEGYWTPLAARQAAWTVAHLTPQEAELLFRELGGMTPSKTSLDRLPKRLSEVWEANRERWEAIVRALEEIPPEAATIAVSLDGVLLAMKDGKRAHKRGRATDRGQTPKGSNGYQEVGCATTSLFDAAGDLLVTRRWGRMPEKKKQTLGEQLEAEAGSVFCRRPDLTVVAVADGAKANWDLLRARFPDAIQVVDFYHAAQHLKGALDIAYGEGSQKSRAQFEKLRHLLRRDSRGVEKVIRSLRHLSRRLPRRQKLRTELRYFRRHRHRMRYADLAAKNLPIGSGIVEAACKTLVTERMKRSGMRWRHSGGQAILTLRGLAQSRRWEPAWRLLQGAYIGRVSLPDNVVPLRRAA